jgi:Domain of unknown function (DUF4430)
MSARPAVAIALLGAALAAAGCGFGAGAEVGEVSLTVTRDYGSRVLLGPRSGGASEADTAMRLLDREAEISTRFGGGFVASIDGLAEATRGGHRLDWFFYVNGVESPVGAADYPLHGGDAVWWDYRDWSAAQAVPAVVGSWPQPFRDGYEGKRRPVVVECEGGGTACAEATSRLRAAGAPLATGRPAGAIRVLVGPWTRLRGDPAAAQLEAGPQISGVFAAFTRRRAENTPIWSETGPSAPGGGYVLEGLDEDGGEVRAFGPSAGLVAATRRYGAPPVWLVTGATERGVAAAAGLLDAADLRDRYAVVAEGGRTTPLPLQRSER